MLSKKEFIALQPLQQKEKLAAIFSELSSPLPEVEHIILLLTSQIPFTKKVLVEIYDKIAITIEGGKQETNEKTASNIHAIHTMMEKDAEASDKEAEELLTDI